jgi:hypothetical protein
LLIGRPPKSCEMTVRLDMVFVVLIMPPAHAAIFVLASRFRVQLNEIKITISDS